MEERWIKRGGRGQVRERESRRREVERWRPTPALFWVIWFIASPMLTDAHSSGSPPLLILVIFTDWWRSRRTEGWRPIMSAGNAPSQPPHPGGCGRLPRNLLPRRAPTGAKHTVFSHGRLLPSRKCSSSPDAIWLKRAGGHPVQICTARWGIEISFLPQSHTTSCKKSFMLLVVIDACITHSAGASEGEDSGRLFGTCARVWTVFTGNAVTGRFFNGFSWKKWFSLNARAIFCKLWAPGLWCPLERCGNSNLPSKSNQSNPYHLICSHNPEV